MSLVRYAIARKGVSEDARTGTLGERIWSMDEAKEVKAIVDSFKDKLSELSKLSKLQWKLASLIPQNDQRQMLLKRMREVSKHVPCPHSESDVLSFGVELLSLPPTQNGCIVEAGAYKGGSTAKFSLFAKRVGRKLVVFDSFEGLPDNTEDHDKSVFGYSIKDWFRGGEFCGSLEEVQSNVSRFGELDVCDFVKGWFDDTMPVFRTRIAAAYLDVDLASSTKTCLKHLWPLIVPGGVVYSQDGDFPLVIAVLEDEHFWQNEVGCEKPHIEGLGAKKLIRIVKD